MNRLVIVGNGFDLAHGLPTAYSDFMRHYFMNCLTSLQTGGRFADDQWMTVEALVPNLGFSGDKLFQIFKTLVDTKQISVSFHNSFFKSMIEHGQFENWVDFESFYYGELVDSIPGFHGGKHFISRGQKTAARRYAGALNLEFKTFRQRFETYLIEQVVKKYQFDSLPQFEPIFDLSVSIDDIGSSRRGHVQHRSEVCVLNFNYTSLPTVYVAKETIINIHGQLGSESNPIIFGYGDERDSGYHLLEDIGIDDYLEFSKSCWYSRTSNYVDLMNFIDRDSFEVVILGHSCGVTDRTLLSTIFEHQNRRQVSAYVRDGMNSFGRLAISITRNFIDKDQQRRFFRFRDNLVFPNGKLKEKETNTAVK